MDILTPIVESLWKCIVEKIIRTRSWKTITVTALLILFSAIATYLKTSHRHDAFPAIPHHTVKSTADINEHYEYATESEPTSNHPTQYKHNLPESRDRIAPQRFERKVSPREQVTHVERHRHEEHTN